MARMFRDIREPLILNILIRGMTLFLLFCPGAKRSDKPVGY